MRAFAVFVAVLLFGCAVYFLAFCPHTFSWDVINRKDVSGDGLLTGAIPQEQRESGPLSDSSTANVALDGITTQIGPNDNRTQDEHKKDLRTTQIEGATPSRTDVSSAQETLPTAQQPLAFAEDSPSPEASAEEILEISALRQEFLDGIGGYGQDPSDPGYWERWQVAQQLADEQLRTNLGEEVFNRLQNESANTQVREN